MDLQTAERARALIKEWLDARLPEAARSRLEFWLGDIRQGVKRALFVAFSAAPGVVGKDDLALTASETAAAAHVLDGWRPGRWSVDQAARTLLLLEFPRLDVDAQSAALDALFKAADVREHASLLRSLPLLPYPAAYLEHAERGVRSNMTAVFEAIAFENPYPWLHFDDARWNRMVLKALFQDLGVDRILGLRERRNAELGRMAQDLLNERRAAHRPAPPDIERVLAT